MTLSMTAEQLMTTTSRVMRRATIQEPIRTVRDRRRGQRRNRRRSVVSDSSDHQQFTSADDHRQRAGSDVRLRQQPVLLAIESDHYSFPVEQDRCAQNNEARRRGVRQD